MPANYWTTYGVGPTAGGANREDLIDLVTMIDPWDTPFFSSAPKGQAQLVTHEWITDALAAVSTAGAIEGDDFVADTMVSRARVNNVTQIFRRNIAVSDTQRAVNPAGIADEYLWQVGKGIKEVTRNGESRVWAIGGQSASGATGTGRIMRSFADFLTAVGTTGNVISSGAVITTAALTSAMEQCYTNGGNPDTIYVSPGVKTDVSGAALPSQFARNIQAQSKSVVFAADILEFDFGLFAVIPDRWMRQATASSSSADVFIVERSKARVDFLRPIRHVPIGKGGDSTRGIVVGEWTLAVLHASAHVRVSGVTT